MRRLTLILFTLLLLAILAGCSVQRREALPTQEPEVPPEPSYAYTAEFTDADVGLLALTPRCAGNGGFYCTASEKTGEAIPENVVREAKRKNREPYNDGRYDTYSTKLYFLSYDGTLTPLKSYAPPAAEANTGSWKSWSCVPEFAAAGTDKNGRLITLEYNAISGNSVPARKADVVPGKNYLEYHLVWYLRTLSGSGSVLSTVKISEESGKDPRALWEKRVAGKGIQTVDARSVPFSWAELGVSREQVISEIVADGDTFRFLARRGEQLQAVCVSLQELPAGEAGKTHLTLAADELTIALRSAVDAFNAADPSACIDLALTDDVAAGLVPDLWYFGADACEAYAAAGLLADLYPWLDEDGELTRENFFANILAALEQDGKLYSTCAGVSFRTVVGASSVVGDKAGWDYSAFISAWGAFGRGTDAFDIYTTSEDVLTKCLTMELNRFVDWQSHTCNFNCEDFTHLLGFAGNFPRSFDYNGHYWQDWDNSDLRIRRGSQMLLEKTVSNFDDAIHCGYEFGEDVTYIGYPTPSGAGNLMTVSTLDRGMNLSMSSACKDPDAAWRFLRRFFTEEYQEEYCYFPVNINVFNRALNDAMAFEYIYDKDGKISHDPKTGKALIISIDMLYLSDFSPVYLYPLTESKAEKLVDLMTSACLLERDNRDVCRLVAESAAPYFAGEINAYEAADAAQKAVSAYLSVFSTAPEA